MNKQLIKMQKLAGLITESQYDELMQQSENSSKPLNESALTIAAGVILGFFGLKLLKAVARMAVGAIGANVKLEPEKLKQVLDKIVEEAVTESGSMLGANLIQIVLIKNQLAKQIDNGEITTLADLAKAFRSLTQ
jgi:biotin-(acetyl-CoA carboxylase) ligase